MRREKSVLSRKLIGCLLVLGLLLTGLLGGCSLPRVSAENRLFLHLSLELLDDYHLPHQVFEQTPVGGLSAITYDRQHDRFYALSDDRSQEAPARFYTLKLTLDNTQPDTTQIDRVSVEGVTLLKTETGELFADRTLDPEGIALTPQQTVFISSEGVTTRKETPPFVDEFDLHTGQRLRELPIPARYLPDATGLEKGQTQGVINNFGFEALTTSPIGTVPSQGEPLRLFVATESALAQDFDQDRVGEGANCRFLHYYLGEGPPVLLAEHIYPLDPHPGLALLNGLSEMLALDASGHFLFLERSFGPLGFGARLYQGAIGGASDTSSLVSLKGKGASTITPIRKQLLLDLGELDITLDNLEGMTLGPQLPDGSQSLILISDDNFSESQSTQVLLFKLAMG